MQTSVELREKSIIWAGTRGKMRFRRVFFSLYAARHELIWSLSKRHKKNVFFLGEIRFTWKMPIFSSISNENGSDLEGGGCISRHVDKVEPGDGCLLKQQRNMT